MAKPRQADRVVEVAYAIAMVVNVIVSVSGYLMYGTGVSDEVFLLFLSLYHASAKQRQWQCLWRSGEAGQKC